MRITEPPQFPAFSPLSHAHKGVIDAYLERYAPYSEFTYGTMWCWNLDETAALSSLNGNLVLRYRGFESGLPYISFLGEFASHKTTLALLRYSEEEFGRSQLCLVPEESLTSADDHAFPLDVQEDRDDFDYVFDLSALATFAAAPLRRKRRAATRFQQTYAPTVRALDLAARRDQELALSLFADWAESRQKSPEHTRDELCALQRVFEIWTAASFVATGVMVDGRLAAFAVCELLPNQYASGLFFKADIRLRGAFEFLRQAQAQCLLQLGRRWMSVQQDLGLPGLRQAKLSYQPVRFLRKYTLCRPVAPVANERDLAMVAARSAALHYAPD